MSEATNYTSINNSKISSNKYQRVGGQKTLEELLKDLLDVQKQDEKRKIFKTQNHTALPPQP